MHKIREPMHYRAVKGRAVRDGNADKIAEADLGLRAAKAAAAIKAAVEASPPLPPEVVAALRQMLQPTRQDAAA